MPQSEKLELSNPRLDQEIGCDYTSLVAPIESRIANLALISEPQDIWLSSNEIAKQLRTTQDFIQKTSDRIGLLPDIKTTDDPNELVELYPPLSTEILYEELIWQREYLKLDEKLSAGQIAEFIGRGRNWTAKTLGEIGVKPVKSRRRKGVLVYNRSIVKTLREINLLVPLDSGWLTLTALAEITGQHKEWVARSLDVIDLKSETRRSSLTGIIREHYPPEAIDIIINMAAQRPPAAGSWLSANAMRIITEKTQDWVENRLKNQYSEFGELRLDDDRRSLMHYPPHILDELLKEIEDLKDIPKSGEYITKHDIAKRVGKSVVWVTKRLSLIDIEPEIRINENNTPSKHYPPTIYDEIAPSIEELKKYPKIGEYMSTTAIARKLEHDPKWVARRLNFLGKKPEIRIDDGNRILECYPPDTVELLDSLPIDILK